MYDQGIIFFVWYSCCIMYGFNDCALCTFCILFRHSRAQYDEFEKCFACMMTVWVVCGDRGLALYVALCANNTQHVQMDCKSSIVCNIVEHVLEIIVVWLQLFIWRLLVYQMRPVANPFFFVSCYFLPGTKNQTVTVQNGTNFREINNLLKDLISCLMSCYQVNFTLICLKSQFKSTNCYVCMLLNNV